MSHSDLVRIYIMVLKELLSVDGRQAVYDGVLRALGNSEKDVDILVKLDVIEQAVKVLNDAARTDMALRKTSYKDAWRLLNDCWKTDNAQNQTRFRNFKTHFLERTWSLFLFDRTRH